MAVTGWVEIEYPVLDPVILPSRIGIDDTVILHANDVRLAYESTAHETRAGFASEIVHIHTLDLIDMTTPSNIRPGVGLDEEGKSRADNIREMLRSALRGSVLTLTTVGDHYAYRVPTGLNTKIATRNAGLVPDGIFARFSLSLRLRQHGAGNADS